MAEFLLGFKELADKLGPTVGQPLTDVHYWKTMYSDGIWEEFSEQYTTIGRMLWVRSINKAYFFPSGGPVPQSWGLPLYHPIILTQGFGDNPDWEIYRDYDGHHGVDLVSPDTRVLSVCDGFVRSIGILPDRPGRGNVIYTTSPVINRECHYYHLKDILIDVGEPVKQGQVIGNFGDTGIVTGPHLHFGIYDTGRQKFEDPYRYIPL